MLDISKLLWTSMNKKISLPWDQTTNNQEQEAKTVLNNNMVNDFNQSQLESSTQNFWSNQQQNIVNNQNTKPWIAKVWQYLKSVNDWLNRLWSYKWVFSPLQQRKIAQLYSNARSKYKTSSMWEEETNEFNNIKNNPIWKRFSK